MVTHEEFVRVWIECRELGLKEVVQRTGMNERAAMNLAARLRQAGVMLPRMRSPRNRIDPEPCDANREGCVEASVGEHIGQPWSRGAPGDRQEVEGESPLR